MFAFSQVMLCFFGGEAAGAGVVIEGVTRLICDSGSGGVAITPEGEDEFMFVSILVVLVLSLAAFLVLVASCCAAATCRRSEGDLFDVRCEDGSWGAASSCFELSGAREIETLRFDCLKLRLQMMMAFEWRLRSHLLPDRHLGPEMFQPS
ncbi:hypothetical protein V8F06_010081 [Rhypophila decipiens]